MVNIDFSHLAVIPAPSKPHGFTPFELKRIDLTQGNHTHQGGAYSLVAALTTLGKLPCDRELSIHFDTIKAPFLVSERVSIAADFGFSKLARRLYRLIGIAHLSAADELVERDGYSAIAAMADVAMQMGVNVRLSMSRSYYQHSLSSQPSEFKRCIEIIGEHQFDVVDDKCWLQSPPNDGEIALVQVDCFDDNEPHWLARSADNTYYDSMKRYYPNSQFGVVGAPWSSRPYKDVGVALILSC